MYNLVDSDLHSPPCLCTEIILNRDRSNPQQSFFRKRDHLQRDRSQRDCLNRDQQHKLSPESQRSTQQRSSQSSTEITSTKSTKTYHAIKCLFFIMSPNVCFYFVTKCLFLLCHQMFVFIMSPNGFGAALYSTVSRLTLLFRAAAARIKSQSPIIFPRIKRNISSGKKEAYFCNFKMSKECQQAGSFM